MATYDQASWEALYSELERLRAERDNHLADIELKQKCIDALYDVSERLRAERNLLREMFNSAERELATEREKVVALSRWFR